MTLASKLKQFEEITGCVVTFLVGSEHDKPDQASLCVVSNPDKQSLHYAKTFAANVCRAVCMAMQAVDVRDKILPACRPRMKMFAEKFLNAAEAEKKDSWMCGPNVALMAAEIHLNYFEKMEKLNLENLETIAKLKKANDMLEFALTVETRSKGLN